MIDDILMAPRDAIRHNERLHQVALGDYVPFCDFNQSDWRVGHSRS
jgi:hypothetical protein